MVALASHRGTLARKVADKQSVPTCKASMALTSPFCVAACVAKLAATTARNTVWIEPAPSMKTKGNVRGA